MTPAAGEVLAGRFRVTGAPLGEGRTGLVLPVQDEHTGEALALKWPWATRAEAPQQAERLCRRAGVLSRLDAPGWVRVRGVFQHADRWLLVTERVRGGALAEVPVALVPAAALLVAEQVACALRAAHAAGVVHGDLRPEAVLLGAEGVRLVDPASLDAEGAPELLRADTHAPEVLAGLPASPRADLYGLGLILRRALGGPSGAHLADAPPAAVRLMHELLSERPEARPASAAVAVQRLRATLDGAWTLPLGRIAPVQPRASWAVHGVDPATGAPAWFADRLSASQARALAATLQAAGWRAEATPVALGLRELALALGLASAVAWFSPFLLAPALGGSVLVWRSRRCRVGLTAALPRALAPLPAPHAPARDLNAALGGGLMLTTGLGLALGWPFAVVPAFALGLWAWRTSTGVRSPSPTLSATRAAAAIAHAELRHADDVALDLLGARWNVEGEGERGRAEQAEAFLLGRRAHAATGEP